MVHLNDVYETGWIARKIVRAERTAAGSEGLLRKWHTTILVSADNRETPGTCNHLPIRCLHSLFEEETSHFEKTPGTFHAERQ